MLGRSIRRRGTRVNASPRGTRRRAMAADHLPHRPLHAHQHRPGHDVVADVQLGDLGDGGDGAHVVVGEAVAGVHGQAQLARQAGGVHHLAQGGLARPLVARVRVGGGVDLDRARVELVRLLHLLEVGVHEQADLDAALLQRLHDRA